tara:strand:+ start:175 stop:1380 length:1206 start_codon:yes stop_codon:yes gene_type:complete
MLSKKCPNFLRKKMMRNNLNVDVNVIKDNNIVIKVAETDDELFQAFSLVQKMYEKGKIVDRNTTGLRVTKFHLLPTTKVIVAKIGDEVIGTVSQIMDTPLGLPIDDFISLDNLRKCSKRICEISSLAISEKWRSNSKGLFYPLTLFSIYYAKEVTSADRLVIVTNERARYVYEDIFLFDPLTINSAKYTSVNDDHAFAQKLDLVQFESRCFQAYAEMSEEKNLYRMYSSPKWKEHLKIDDGYYNTVPLMSFNKSTLDVFFDELGMLNELKDSEKQVIYNLYSIFEGSYGENFYIHQRRFPRFYAKMKSEIHISGSVYHAECIEVSRGGASLVLFDDCELQKGQELTMKVYLSDYNVCEIRTKVIWKTNNTIGVEVLIDKISEWYHQIDKLEEVMLSRQLRA